MFLPHHLIRLESLPGYVSFNFDLATLREQDSSPLPEQTRQANALPFEYELIHSPDDLYPEDVTAKDTATRLGLPMQRFSMEGSRYWHLVTATTQSRLYQVPVLRFAILDVFSNSAASLEVRLQPPPSLDEDFLASTHRERGSGAVQPTAMTDSPIAFWRLKLLRRALNAASIKEFLIEVPRYFATALLASAGWMLFHKANTWQEAASLLIFAPIGWTILNYFWQQMLRNFPWWHGHSKLPLAINDTWRKTLRDLQQDATDGPFLIFETKWSFEPAIAVKSYEPKDQPTETITPDALVLVKYGRRWYCFGALSETPLPPTPTAAG